MPQVLEINNIDEIEPYHLAWSALHQQTRDATIFQSLDWLKAIWKHFGHGKKLRLLVVYSGGDPIGMVPLVVTRERTRVGTVRVLTYPLDEWGSFYGPIGPNPTATLLAAMRYLCDTPRDWDMLDLRWINRDETDHGRTATAMSFAGLACRESMWKQTALIETSISWDAYFASRTSKFRNNVRRAEKRLGRLGEIRFERYRPPGSAYGSDDPRWDLFDTCVELSRQSWQGSSTTGNTLSHEEVREFLRDVHVVAVRLGFLDLNLLWLNDWPVAFAYNYQCDGHVTGMRVGVHPNFVKHGAGTVLYQRMFRNSFDRGDRVFDLGTGSFETKRSWLTRTVPNYRCTRC